MKTRGRLRRNVSFEQRLVIRTSSEPVVELGVGQQVHAAAVGLRVADGDRVAAHLAPLAVHGHAEGCGFPGGQRPQRCIEVDGVAPDQPGVVGDAVGVRVEAQAGDAHVRDAVGLGDVEQALLALDRDARRLAHVARDPEHAGQVVASPRGNQGELCRSSFSAPASGRSRPSPPTAATVSP